MSIENQTPDKSSPEPELEKKEDWNKNVLLADDDENVRSLTVAVLRSFGCTVEAVDDGEKLIARLETSKPGEFGLVMTDMVMPKVSGLEVIAQIKKDMRFKKLPLILYSGTLDSEVKRIVEDSGGVSLAKPFLVAQLKEAVEKAISKSEK